jgi:hypothetical protein
MPRSALRSFPGRVSKTPITQQNATEAIKTAAPSAFAPFILSTNEQPLSVPIFFHFFFVE